MLSLALSLALALPAHSEPSHGPIQWIEDDWAAAKTKAIKDNKLLAVDVWATWCGPCLSGMPHLSELQAKYGDEVTVLGVTSEDAGTVERFLERSAGNGKTGAEVVKYRLAIDDDGATTAAYMRAAGQNSIPTAFIVGRDGVLRWIGHPSAMDGPLKAVVDGTW